MLLNFSYKEFDTKFLFIKAKREVMFNWAEEYIKEKIEVLCNGAKFP